MRGIILLTLILLCQSQTLGQQNQLFNCLPTIRQSVLGTTVLFLLDLSSQTSSVVFSIVCYINNYEQIVKLIKHFLVMILYYFRISIIFKQLTACTSGMHNFTKSQEPFQNSRRQKGNMNFHSEHPHILGVTVQNVVAPATWQPG